MKNKLTIISAAATVVLAMSVSGCGRSAQASESGNITEAKVIRYQGWTNSVTLPELAADLGYLGDIKLDWVGNTISGPQDIQSVATGQTDIGGAFSGAVVKLISAGAPVTATINYYGTDAKTFQSFYVLNQSPIKSPRDLLGKKVGVNALGAHSEALVFSYLRKSGLTPAEIKQVQLVVLPPIDIEAALRRGQIDVGVLDGVLQDHAIATGGLRSIFNDYTNFGAFAGGPYVFRNDFIAKNPVTVRTVTTGIAKAIKWENDTPKAEVIARVTKIIEGRKRSESTANLKYWKSAGVPNYGTITDHDFTRWSDWLKETGIVTTPLTPAKYYTNKFNDLAVKQASK